MTMVEILPVSADEYTIYQAISGEKQSQGKTAGEALDALTAQLSDEESGTLVIIQNLRPDHFFNATQQNRLSELMDCWRSARDRGENLPDGEQAELEALTEAEVRAAAKRAAKLADELGR